MSAALHGRAQVVDDFQGACNCSVYGGGISQITVERLQCCCHSLERWLGVADERKCERGSLLAIDGVPGAARSNRLLPSQGLWHRLRCWNWDWYLIFAVVRLL